MADRRGNGSLQSSAQAKPRDLAVSIEEDFRALVELLARQAERLGHGDPEVLGHIARATAAAERGLRLSERLVKMAEPAEERNETKHQA